ncbi:MAG: tetratricopeptide repeat protein [Candidatus Thioglobus sp.]|uniref:tetratricopeptide repeat protein n=1 Tax=Candidatus Thioglobus sp. TaxID=2026721 RepID=UPI0019A8762A|nr:tetratricopeptide repeat protein [Candidatus Thioglobus sp.]MBC8494129.1 sel1 repeat family protein [Candidatus Thioglobus pontius]MBL6976523.1 sel1 repeat family protein [Candidatus Thioglobus sp.]MBL6983990.1 sel1 repeat family protein [Candidatus Thioglobus sp.]MDC9726881.1 tetratricopeptide repeat protein [Candidatus Thioglobus sp.]
MNQMHAHLLAESELKIDTVKIQQQAYLGDADSQYKLADIFQKGKGVAKNSAHAFYWYQRAAQQGNLPAQFNVWYAYLTGEGTSANKQLADKWYARATLKNSSSTQSIINQLIGTTVH